MPRPVRPRPVGEYLAVLTRLLRQLELDTRLQPARAARVKQAVSTAMAELQEHLVGSDSPLPRRRQR